MSTHLDILRVIACLSVLLLHSGNSAAIREGGAIVDYFSRYLVVGCVPLFFAISGALAVQKLGSWEYFLRRAYWLLLSFAGWNLILVGAVLLCQLLLVLLGLQFEFGFLSDKIKAGLLSIFGVTEHYPIVYQFWFVRDLILCMVAMALVSLFLKAKSHFFWGLVIFSFAAGQYVSQNLYLSSVFFALAAFFLGGLVPTWLYTGFSRYGLIVAVLAALMLLIIFVGFEEFILKSALVSALSVLFLIGLSSVLTERKFNMPRYAVGATYFVFAAHEPLLTFLIKLFLLLEISRVFVYFVSVILVGGFLLLVFNLVSRGRSTVFKLFIYGRG